MTEELAERIADTMFALATPSRVRIRCGNGTVGELIAATGMAQPAVSHQLRLLRDHRLVVAERAGASRVRAVRRARGLAARRG